MTTLFLIPPITYLFSFIYIWAFWIMVPCFAICFFFFGVRNMWVVEKILYSQNSKVFYLFKHFDKTDLQGPLNLLYRMHPFFAGVALLTSYRIMYVVNDTCQTNELEDPKLIALFLISSTLMAYFGGHLTTHMFGNASAKSWTLLQSQLVYIYNTIIIFSRIMNFPTVQSFMYILSFSLLICAGVFERFYVLFVLPLIAVKNEQEYRTYYSYQFKAATVGSWIVGVVWFAKCLL